MRLLAALAFTLLSTAFISAYAQNQAFQCAAGDNACLQKVMDSQEAQRKADADKLEKERCRTITDKYSESAGKVFNTCKGFFPSETFSSPDDVEVCVEDLRLCLEGRPTRMSNKTAGCSDYVGQKRATFLSSEVEKLETRKKDSKTKLEDLQKELLQAQKEQADSTAQLQENLSKMQFELQELPQAAQKELLELGMGARNDINKLRDAINRQGELLRTLKQVGYPAAQLEAVNEELAIAQACEEEAYNSAKARKAAINQATAAGQNQVNQIKNETFQDLFNKYLASCKSRKRISNSKIKSATKKEIATRDIQVKLTTAAQQIQTLTDEVGQVNQSTNEKSNLIRQNLALNVQRLQSSIVQAQSQLQQSQQQFAQKTQLLQSQLQAAQLSAREEESNYKTSKTELDGLRRRGILPETDKDFKDQVTKALDTVSNSNISEALLEEYGECRAKSQPPSTAGSGENPPRPATSGGVKTQ